MRRYLSPRARFALMASFLVTAMTGIAGAQTWGFPLVVQNPTDVDMIDVPVATGLPLPHDLPIYDPGQNFILVDDTGTAVPSQCKVLSRWFGERDDLSRNAKWVLSMFRASVPAQSSRTWYVRAGIAQPGLVTHADLANFVEVSTGSATFRLSKVNYTVFDEVRIGGQVVTAGPGALEVRDVAGNLVPVTLTGTVIEDVGTVRTVVKQTGRLASLGLDFTVRYFFWTGSHDVKVDFRLENNGSNAEMAYMGSTIDHAHFQDLKLVVHVAGGVTEVVSHDDTIPLVGQSYSIDQDFAMPANQLDILSGFSYTRKVDTSPLGTGARYEGALAANGANGAISVSVDRFWQNFPKAYKVSGDRLELDLFPEFGEGPLYTGQYGLPGGTPTDSLSINHYRFEAGRWKTHTANFAFRTASQPFTTADLHKSAEIVNNPLMALPPRNWPFRLFAFGDLIMERRNWTDVPRQRFERLMDVLAHDEAAEYQDSLGKVGLPKFRERGGTYGGRVMYGWDSFGDVAWGDGFSSLHYDLTFGTLINYYRTGDYAFFTMGREMAAHRRDYDQNHTQNPLAKRSGGQAYEKGFFHGNFSPPTPSHTWVHGLLLNYVMTGDEGSRESALEVGEFIKRQHPETWDGQWGSRILGWQIEGLMNLYNYLGDAQYVTLAKSSILRWDFQDNAIGEGGLDGVVPNQAWTVPHAQTWMHAIVLNAICKYYLNTFDPQVLPCIQRLGDFMATQVVFQAPAGPDSNRSLARVWEQVGPNNYQNNPSGHHVWVTSAALSWASLCTRNPLYMAVAEDLYGSVARYHQTSSSDATPRDYNDPASYSLIAFRMHMFPNAETKIMSNIALWGQPYLIAKSLWDQNF